MKKQFIYSAVVYVLCTWADLLPMKYIAEWYAAVSHHKYTLSRIPLHPNLNVELSVRFMIYERASTLPCQPVLLFRILDNGNVL